MCSTDRRSVEAMLVVAGGYVALDESALNKGFYPSVQVLEVDYGLPRRAFGDSHIYGQ